jgi:hypothetical protein
MLVLGPAVKLVTFIKNISTASKKKREHEMRRLEAEALAREAQNILNLRLSNLTISLVSAYSYMGPLLQFVNVSDKVIENLANEEQTSFDYVKFADDIEKVASMKVCQLPLLSE